MQFDENIKKIAEFYGEEQLSQLAEECCELAVSCNHFRRGDKKKFFSERMDDLISEICDVEIMISQIKYLLNIPDEKIEEISRQKLQRQIERIDSECSN